MTASSWASCCTAWGVTGQNLLRNPSWQRAWSVLNAVAPCGMPPGKSSVRRGKAGKRREEKSSDTLHRSAMALVAAMAAGRSANRAAISGSPFR